MIDAKTPLGFKISAIRAGIKKEGLDLGLIYSERPATAAAVFTKNAFPAAPILVSKANLLQAGRIARAVIVNSGNANAANGEEGMAAARFTAEAVAAQVGCAPAEVFVSSTGVIGRPLPVDKIAAALPDLVSSLSPNRIDEFARSIMTTDTFPKVAAVEFRGARILGFSKGAGMIHPNMATMLAFVITDAQISEPELDRALRDSVDRSFHSISVDGDTSTNDTVLVMANGASGVAFKADDLTAPLTEVCQTLAKAIVRDGEGATKFVELVIEGAPTDQAAREIGRTIARSPLVKTAIYGCDPNWGRLIAAVGNSGIPLSSDRIDLFIDDIPLNGGDLKLASQKMASSEVRIRVSLHSGDGRACVWTCDLTEQYIKINADYTT